MSQTPLQQLLEGFRQAAKTPREQGTYFEELTRTYFRHEPFFKDRYSDVWMLSDVPAEVGLDKIDKGVDLVAKTHDTGEYHAIQCKFVESHRSVSKGEIDSFLSASSQQPFTQRFLVCTTDQWSSNARAVLFNQQPPVNIIGLRDLENSLIDWSQYQANQPPTLRHKFGPRPHQQAAITSVLLGLKTEDRGKLIMACGTGKTFTSLKIAEQQAGPGQRVLFLVPSLALVSQTLTEWTQQCEVPLHSFAVCSDSEIGRRRTTSSDDVVHTYAHELQYPATTNAQRLAEHVEQRHDSQHMTVVFSTYHSIEVVSKAQQLGLADFDLVICDEAHRTTGATFESDLESAFVRVHDNDFLKARKRLYMTATPRIYGNPAKAKADLEDIELCSMDDDAIYGKQLHAISFSQAVQLGLLTDYKVIVLSIGEDHVSDRLQDLLKDDSNQLKVDDAARIVGCWKALAKEGLAADLAGDAAAMRRAVAFCQVIEPTTGKKQHRISSKQISEMFQTVVDAYRQDAEELSDLRCEAAHVDGSMNATEKGEKIAWLKEKTDGNTCRVLCNVRCLSEGVDVPALDAVLFLSPRNSKVEVIQSVGRVMRKAPGKKLGYVILPVVVPSTMAAADALDDNKTYKVVWDVLQALRAHDDRFDADINKVEIMNNPMPRMEIVDVTNTLTSRSNAATEHTGRGDHNLGEAVPGRSQQQQNLPFQIDGLEKALYARLVKKCGRRMHWEEWANDVAKIANTHITRITQIVSNPKNKAEIDAFQAFADELRDDLNDSITNEEVIEMLAQHQITKPVFDALFDDETFAQRNPVSQGMQTILNLLQQHQLSKEADTLTDFYDNVRLRASGIDKAEGKQKIVVELYDKFFRNAFPKMTERLGIVYTPVEVVDFIIHSVNDILQEEFGQTLGSPGVHILDPFVGTGTFITRLLQSGLITPEQLPHKYNNEIHCNEIVLLAYYIAAINIEAVYHSILGEHAAANEEPSPAYEPFTGICLTDTFQMYETEDQLEQFFPDNSERRKRQKGLKDIRVIVGNPPYSAGQTSANDNNQNVAYPTLDSRIRNTYAKHSTATNKNALYDSYIRAIRWASDRLGDTGVIGFVTNAGFLEANTADGMRKCLAEDFDKIYVFHLRGNQRTSGERSRKEGGKIFGSGSRAPIAISLFIKTGNRQPNAEAKIFWHDIGDYLTQQQKLKIVSRFRRSSDMTVQSSWRLIQPDQHGDWVNQGDPAYGTFIAIGNKREESMMHVFDIYSRGLETGRDPWVYNYSKDTLEAELRRFVDTYNAELCRYCQAIEESGEGVDVGGFVDADPTKIKWTRDLKNDLRNKRSHLFDPQKIREGKYRPFQRTWNYFCKSLNSYVNLLPRMFPFSHEPNPTICLSGGGHRGSFSVLITESLPSINFADMDNNQCFSLFQYREAEQSGTIAIPCFQRFDGISNSGLLAFRCAYPNASVSKEELFFYIYGLLHSQEYRERFKHNLSKELPRIPAVKKFEDFQAFSQAGRDLAHWHLEYETVAMHPVTVDLTLPTSEATGRKQQTTKSSGKWTKARRRKLSDEHLYVRKMKFAKVPDPETGKKVNDKTTVIYNDFITIRDIPLDAFDYVVNGKPAIEWVMERQAVTTDKKSGIVNDANLWATETMNDAAYPLELLMRVITVSLETNQIVNNLPALDI